MSNIKEFFDYSPEWQKIRELARERYDAGHRPVLLTEGNPKTAKSIKEGVLTGVLHLSPAYAAGKKTTCPFASFGCATNCLNVSGRGALHMLRDGVHVVQIARVIRTIWYFEDYPSFERQLEKEIVLFCGRTRKKGLIPAIRLNGTSDILWERTGLMGKFPDVQFYDYTKIPNRDKLPSNYDLTFSMAEDNEETALGQLESTRVAVVFRVKPNKPLPTEYKGYKVVNGDTTDLRYLEPHGVIVGLTSKGQAFKDTTGFVKEYS